MALPFYNWSRTASSNATADSTVNWAEGMAPSAVNDSARAMMASTAAFRDDISGAIITGGTSTAYTITSYQVFNSLANLDGKVIAFTPHATSGGTCTLNVDGLGAKPLRSAPSVELPSGTLVLGTPYVAVYNNSDSAFYLHGIFGNPYNMPLAGGMDFWGTTVPNSAFAFPIGQAISRTTYSALFDIMGTTYGVGDGSTTFNLPDKTGRVSAMKEATATRLTTAGGGVDGATMGSASGQQTKTLITDNLPPYTPSGTISVSGNTPVREGAVNGSPSTQLVYMPGGGSGTDNISLTVTGATFTGSAQGGSSTPIGVVQPTIICNYIIRII